MIVALRKNSLKQMRKIYLVLILCLLYVHTFAQVKEYFLEYNNIGLFDNSLEESIVEQGNIFELEPFYSDTLSIVRQQAYYLTYKIGINSNDEVKHLSIHRLIDGVSESNLAISGNCLHYLQDFPNSSFPIKSLHRIDSLLKSPKHSHYREIYLLAGYVGVGIETIQQQLLLPDNYNKNQQWVMRLALARLGHKESMDKCMEWAKQIEDGNDKVAYLVPDLIYTRQPDAIKYCISILMSDEKNCLSPNPDVDAKILCGYRVLELLAPVIKDFPYTVGSAGYLQVNDYQEALFGAREWFKSHPDFEIITTFY